MGFNLNLRQYVWESLEPDKPLIVPGSPETLALPAATDVEAQVTTD